MKFNVSSKGKSEVVNYEGAPAYYLSPKWHLYSAVVTTVLSDNFYETSAGRLNQLLELIGQNDPQFVARLAVYAREQMNLRSVPLVLAVELSKIHSGDSLVGRLTSRIIQRVDEITELLACYQLSNRRKGKKKLNRLSKQLQAGLQAAFNKFDEYQFAKYNRSTEVKLCDALFLVHPKAKDENQQLLFDKIVEDKLTKPYTWETELSALGRVKYESNGAKKAAFKQKWEELIDSEKLGYMALLRNLRNILDAEVSTGHVKRVCKMLAAEDRVLKSKQLPFRFLAAYRELSKINSGYAGQVMEALEKAVTASARNIAGFDESTRVLVACDVSGSMYSPVSAKSAIKNYDIGLMLGMLLKSRCANVVSGIFGDTWKTVNLPGSGVLTNVEAFYKREGEVGYSTNGHLVLQDLVDRRQVMDKIMIFTDCQMWDSSGVGATMREVWKEYKTIAPGARLYLFDLAGHGTTPLNITANDVYLVAGWSDRIFDMLEAFDRGEDALKWIEKIEL
ncbi:MAG: TROVE domain-containing protein [Tannerella sp.]|jgi:hypothetical protein|nr:TROVE domain-containing protein [Tannerella sp.]